MKPSFSIRYKFLSTTAALLALCVGAYLWLATKEFKSDKRALVYDFNLSLVANTSTELDAFFSGVADKMRLAAFFARGDSQTNKLRVADLFRDKQDIVFVGKSNRFAAIDDNIYSDSEFSKVYGVDDDYFTKRLVTERPIPFKEIQMQGEALWNASLPNGPMLIGYGKSVVEEDDHGAPVDQFAVIGYVRADRILTALKDGQPNDVYVVSKTGEVLAHADSKIMDKESPLPSGLAQIALKSQVKKSVAEFSENGESFLAAYAGAVKNQAYVLSQISEGKAFLAVNRLVLRSLIFASTVVTLAFLVAIFFSRSLTRPLDLLMSGMRKVSSGDLSEHIDVKSRDEIAVLAHSFNQMIRDLKHSREELEDINRELENKVKERTHELELQNRAVKEAQEALLRTTRLAAIGEVAGQAAHEVLNPLTTIISRLNKLKDRIENERQKEAVLLKSLHESWQKDYSEGGFQKLKAVWESPSTVKSGATLWQEDIENLSTIGERLHEEFQTLSDDTKFLIQESERIGRIVNSFRNLNSTRSERAVANMNSLCERSIQIMADLAARDEITIEKNFASGTVTALVDEDEFLQVMTNLIRNAVQSVKAGNLPAKKGLIRIETSTQGEVFYVDIFDNGVGVSEQNKKRLFEKNFSTKTKTEGTGLGLSISRRLVRAVHGDLTLQETPLGAGAHFRISLPLHRDDKSRGVA
jgi:signal transduction histidine kinase